MEFKTPQQQQQNSTVSMAISEEISRFESVHPSIYAIYELIEHLEDVKLAAEIRENVVQIEDSFVNSQEWTLPQTTPTLHLGLLGAPTSPKSTLVHRYLTSTFLIDHSPEGGRFKKQITLRSQPLLLLIRDEGGPPELQFTHWLDTLILVAGCHDDVQTCFTYASRLNNYKSLVDIPLVLMTTTPNETVNNLFKKIPHKLFFKVSMETGENVEHAFEQCCLLGLDSKKLLSATASTPNRKINRRRSNLFQKIPEAIPTTTPHNPLLGSGRAIPIKQGYLNKKSFKLKKWKKKYIILTQGKLSYYDNINNYMESKTNKKFVELKHANVKIHGDKQIVMTTLTGKTLEFEAVNTEERNEWVAQIEKGIFFSLSGTCEGGGTGCGVLDGNGWGSRMVEVCADCGSHGDVSWIVINFGVVVCIGCSGIHRGLGCHVSKVRSGVLDTVGPWILQIPLLLHGNVSANEKIYEFSLKQKLITSSSTSEEKSDFIKRKYANLEYVPFLAVSKDKFLLAIRNRDFINFMILLLRVEKYCLFLWVEEILGEIVRGCGTREEIEDDEEWMAVGAWVQVVLWKCEDMEESDKNRLKAKLLEDEFLLGEELRGVFDLF